MANVIRNGRRLAVFVALLFALSGRAQAETLTIASVNSPDILRMQTLSGDFKRTHPDIDLQFVTYEEAILRQKLTTDISTNSGQFDVLMIGTYEVPIWAKQGWLAPLDDLGPGYDEADLLPPIRNGLSLDGKLYASPFYGESSMLFYRKDLFAKAGLSMPAQPTWDFVTEAAHKLTDRAAQVYGACLRGKPGWGDNMAFIVPIVNAYGGRIFDEAWKPQFDQPEWKHGVSMYVKLLQDSGPPGAASNSFNENLSLFSSGHCGMWVDATVAAGTLNDPKQSAVADRVGFAPAPCQVTCKDANWLWAWALAVPNSSRKKKAAETFISWATDKHFIDLVAADAGWVNAPPGTRTSLYQNPDYLKAAPFAKPTLAAIDSADPGLNGTLKAKPYYGVQFAAIPEFQGIGTTVGQLIAGALTGQTTVDAALAKAQSSSERAMQRAGYYK